MRRGKHPRRPADRSAVQGPVRQHGNASGVARAFSGTVNAAFGLSIYGGYRRLSRMAEYRQTKAARGEEGSPWEELAVGAGYGGGRDPFERIGINKTGAAIRSVSANMADAVLRRDANCLPIAMSTAESVGVNMTEGARRSTPRTSSTHLTRIRTWEGVRASSVAGGLQGTPPCSRVLAVQVSAAYHTGRARGAALTIGDVGRAPWRKRFDHQPLPGPSRAGAAPVSPGGPPRWTGCVGGESPRGHRIPRDSAARRGSSDSDRLRHFCGHGKPTNGPLIPPASSPASRTWPRPAIIMRPDHRHPAEPVPSEFMAARRARPVTEYAYTDNPDMACVLGAAAARAHQHSHDEGDANASAQSAEGVGGQAGQVAVRGSDVPAVSTPAGVAGALPTADQGRGVAVRRMSQRRLPVGDGVGEVVRGEGRRPPISPEMWGKQFSRQAVCKAAFSREGRRQPWCSMRL